MGLKDLGMLVKQVSEKNKAPETTATTTTKEALKEEKPSREPKAKDEPKIDKKSTTDNQKPKEQSLKQESQNIKAEPTKQQEKISQPKQQEELKEKNGQSKNANNSSDDNKKEKEKPANFMTNPATVQAELVMKQQSKTDASLKNLISQITKKEDITELNKSQEKPTKLKQQSGKTLVLALKKLYTD